MSTAFEMEFPGVSRLGTRVPSWYVPGTADSTPERYWGEQSDEGGEDVGMEAVAFRDGDRVWVESWHEDVGLTTFWECPDEPTAIRLADYIVRGGL